MVTGTSITALPFYGSGDYLGAGTGGDGTARANALVSAACNDGEAIRTPQWYTLQAARLGRVVVHADALTRPSGVDDLPHGTAFVDLRSGRVLACNDATVTMRGDRAVGVVAYFSGFDQDCENPEEYHWCRGVQLRVFVDTVGAPPPNVLWGDAEPVDALPFRTSVDLSLAGADQIPLVDYQNCLQSSVDPWNETTAWWRITPAEDGWPSLTVDATRNWVDVEEQGRPGMALLEEVDGWPQVLPLADPEDCDSRAEPQAGRSYLVAAAVEHDWRNSRPLTPGGPVDVRMGDVAEPRVPQVLTATEVGRRSAMLFWQAPAPGGQAEVTRFRVTWREVGARKGHVRTVTVPVGTLTYAIKGLAPGKAYDVAVRAVSDAGASVAATATVLTQGAGTKSGR